MPDDTGSSKTWILIAISYALVGIVFGLLLYESFFTDGSALWTALSAFGSIALALVTVHQNFKIHEQADKNSEREATASKNFMDLSVQANAISERMIRINEERYYPFLSCHCGSPQRFEIEKPAPISQRVGYSVSFHEIPIYEIAISDFDYTSDGQSVRIRLPVIFKNTSQAVITQIMFSSITWTIPETCDCKLKTDEHRFNTLSSGMYPSAVMPNSSIVVNIIIDTNLDAIKQHLFSIPTTFILSLIIHTLKHKTSQDVILEFASGRNINIRYNFHNEDIIND